MLDNKKMGQLIASQRRKLGWTQQQLASHLNVSFQAVSRWENGNSIPNVEILCDLAEVLAVSVDEILAGEIRQEEMSYRKAGVNIAYTDAIKNDMKKYLKTSDVRVLNEMGAFASLYDIDFPKIKHPVLVLKSEEPGSKQKLAMEYGYTESICHDMINHLVNDIVVMGARPLAVLDTIICGHAEKETISSLVKGMAEACQNNDCSLVGGETSIQPQVVEKGLYVLTSSIAGIVEKNEMIDGSRIEEGDVVLAVASNGLHTNGYSLVRLLMEEKPFVKLDKIEGETFIEKIMVPHRAYYPALKGIFGRRVIHGMAHITGSGIAGNLKRVIPEGLSALIDLSEIQTLPIFTYIKNIGGISDEEMLSTFNCGVGLIIVAPAIFQEEIQKHISAFYPCYRIGEIKAGKEPVQYFGRIQWRK